MPSKRMIAVGEPPEFLGQDGAISALRQAGYVLINDARRHLFRAQWYNVRKRHGIMQEWDRTPGERRLSRKLVWSLWRKRVERDLLEAVFSGRLTIYAWPGRFTAEGYRIDEAPQEPWQVDPQVIRALLFLHDHGLPDYTLNYRLAQVTRLRRLTTLPLPAPDALLVMREDEFIAWVEEERSKARWPSQPGWRDPDDGLRRPRPKIQQRSNGRPPIVYRVADVIVEKVLSGSWSFRSVRALRDLLISLPEFADESPSAKTVERAIGEAWERTSDRRFGKSARKRAQKGQNSSKPHVDHVTSDGEKVRFELRLREA